MKEILFRLLILGIFLAISIWQTFKIQFFGGKIVFLVFDAILIIIFVAMFVSGLKNTTQ
jgi:K+ transporter